jgi:hypothetical protein
MKKTILLVFLVIAFVGYSQEKKASEIDAERSLTDTSQLRSSTIGNFATVDDLKVIQVSLSSGISSATSSFSDNSYAGDGSFFELSGAYYFSKIGLGLSLGQTTNPTSTNLSDYTNSLGFPTLNTSEDWKITYYGFGPEFKTSFNKIEAKFILRTGIMNIKPVNFEISYNENADVSTPIYGLQTDKTSKVSYLSSGIKIGYNITTNLNVFATADYLSALSDELTITERTIADTNRNGIIDIEDILKLDGAVTSYEITSKTIKPQTTNFGVGLSYSFGENDRTEKPYVRIDGYDGEGLDPDNGGAEKPSDESHSNPYFVDSGLSGEMPSIKNSGSIVFTNPAKEKAEKKNKQRKLVNVLPKNNSHFNTENEIKKFSWKVIGTKISNPQFILEVTKIGNNQQSQRIYIEKTSKTSLGATNIFKENKISDGQYRWKVTETTTGISSNPSFFTMTQCEIDFTISNEEIECLGYEQENRKFKICFDVTYASTSGDLTFVNPGSGLSVYDQTYAALSYTLVSPNPTLVVQIGASTTTVSYCFEVTVSASVTGIGFGLQGDDLDPSPITCQPGVSSSFDELPDCICDECEEIELSFDDFNISLNGGTGNQFNFNGNINVNVPIYGIEFQVQSYSYTASPSACSDGVNSVEESGMILMPGTSINGSTTLEIPNETVSGSPSSNDNASKFVKYTSNTALTGAIPINLTIGLPGPLDGLDPSCCLIEYTVCIKVRIFYEDDNCKSCVFTHCFNFNNQ